MKHRINNLHLGKSLFALVDSRSLAIMVIIFGWATMLVLQGCDNRNKEILPDPAFSKYITSFTAGEVSVESPVVVQLAEIPAGIEPGAALPEGLFMLDPAVAGKALLEPGGLIRFIPDKPLMQDTHYRVAFSLGKLLETGKTFRVFRFGFATMAQDFTVTGEGLQSGSILGYHGYSYTGTLLTADAAGPEAAAGVVEVVHHGKKIPLTWSHSSDRRTHTFVADSLMRDESERTELVVIWDGKPLSVKKKGNLSIPVPAAGEFSVLSVKAEVKPEQQVEVFFSDPLAMDQPVEGMAEFPNAVRYTWQIDGNRLILWPSEKIDGESRITLFRGWRSSGGKALTETAEYPVFFKNLKPEIRLLGKGVIVPEGGSLSMPFEAVSLKSVDLRIIKIFPSNMIQFLQENQVDGESEIKKVGRLVYQGKVDLNPDDPAKFHTWSTYRVDLDRYISPEQGAVYRVELRMRRAYSLYDCGAGNSGFPGTEADPEPEDWDSPGWYSLYYWPDGYEWSERDNPCHIAYYNSSRFVSRNIFASNLGMLAKEGKGFRYTFVITNLKSALPEDETEISLFSYQHQLLGKTVTGNTGMAAVTLTQKPFVAIARKGGQTGYLRLDDGSSLSLSNFDVTGDVVQEGVKGFLYGERGVWRPGDPLCLTFILDDPDGRMPDNTPVIFRLINARGQEVERRVATAGENGFYPFRVNTRSDDPTGNWYAQVRVGGALFEKRIKIETVRPNRLKINMELPNPVKGGVKQEAVLQAAWLHGAVARSLKSVVECEMFPMKTVFKGYEKFTFDNPGVVFFPSKKVIFEGRVDENGKAVIPLDFPANNNAAGKMKAWFTTRVFEEGGDFSINVQEAEFSPFKKYLGLRMPAEEDGWYQTGKVYKPEVVAVSANGKPLPLGNTEVSLYKIDWRWWWESGEDYLARYVSGKQFLPLKTWSLNSSASSAQFELQVDYRDWRDNGRYLLFARDAESGHATGITFYMSEWGGWRTDALPEGATMLSLCTDKDKYMPGEKIRVTLPSSLTGRALVSLETGKAVQDIFWVKTTENETSFEVEVKPGMAPTLYIHVTLIQPYGSTLNDAPIRLYGVQSVSVEDPATVLEPLVAMKEELEPEGEFLVTVKEAKGKAMTYTLAIVEEGLLDLTGYKTPDPHAAFYAREALGVKTYDLFDLVAGAYGAQLEKAFAVGGDEDQRVAGSREANRFQPVVLFAGPFTLRKGEAKSHPFKMPNYVGSVRAMVVAGNKGAYGHAEKTVKVRKALMLLATLPRVAGPGEELSLPVEVFAMKDKVREVTLSVETNGLVSVAGDRGKRIMFNGVGDQTVWFRLKAEGKTGVARVKVTATGGGESAVSVTEFEVRNPNPPVLLESSKLLGPGTSWKGEVPVPGIAGTNEAFLELSVIPGLHLSRHLENLVTYPHGCAEQTVSSGFGQLYLENLVQMPADQKTRAEENIRQSIQRLGTLQTPGGGFACWPGQNAADEWSTSYAGHFLTLAARKGYSVPADLKARWLAYQQSRARAWKPLPAGDLQVQKQEALIQAYRLYSLALAGSPEQGVMNRFREEVTPWPQARWRLAAAYLLSGQPAAADQLLQQLQPEAEPYQAPEPTFGSELRDKAMILETLLLKNDRQRAFPLVNEMAGEIGKSDWLSTQTAAWCFYALSRYFGTIPGDGSLDATVTLAGKPQKVHSALPMVKLPIPLGELSHIVASVDNTGSAPLHARLVARGVPLQDTSGVRLQNLRVRSLFTGRDGKEVNPAALPQGSDLFLSITVSHPGMRGPYRDLALTTLFPSGWEILNSRVNDIPSAQGKNFDYQDIRDDRAYTYFSLNTGESKTFRFSLNSAYEGKFFMPAFVCEGMYDNSVYARIPGQWVNVVKR